MKTFRRNSTEIMLVGPIVKKDGFTNYTSVALSSSSVAVAFVHDTQGMRDISGNTWVTTTAPGYFWLTLTSAITSVVGPATIVIQNSTDHLPVKQEYEILGSAPFDALYGSAPNILTSFDIGLLYESDISSTDGALRWECSAGLATNNNFKGQTVTLEDISTGNSHVSWVASVSATNNLIVAGTSATFTPVAGDIVRVHAYQHPTYVFNTYDPPTRTELTTDTNSILEKMRKYFRITLRNDTAVATDDSTEINLINQDDGSGAGTYANTDGVPSNLTKINSITIIGSGSADSLFRTSAT